ncbi:MAG: NADPH-dependent F420 reductase [Anaerolineae bacterium]|nr:NADPH-dependent F420 reductase [Anaerolineae bacterium]
MTKTVAILGGTGHEGPGLALRWARSGYKVILGSRQAEKARSVANELNQKLGKNLIKGEANAIAAQAAEICVLTVPYKAQEATLSSLREVLQGKVLINVTVPLQPPHVTHVNLPPGGSASEEAQAMLGEGVRVVAAFQNVGAAHLANDKDTIDCDVLVCGDDKDAKAEAITLAEAAGMRGFDAGPLKNAVAVEALTPVLIGLNIRYKVKAAGIKISGIK